MNKIFMITLLLAFSLSSLAQTKTFDYLNAGLPNDCNVFDPAVTIDGASHTSWAGGVTFNTTNGLGLSTQRKNSPPTSTAFKINYSFISGVNYNIQIIASGRSEVFLKTSVVPNVTNFVTSSQTACTMDANAYNYSTAGFGQFSSTTTTSSATYTIPQFSIPSGNSSQYLYIWSSGGRASSDLDVLYISKIIITATPIISFSLNVLPTSITCGSTTPVTFTVNNSGGSLATGYTWNLGSTPNGWLYNGSAAPATIPTLSSQNTLQLTPVCGNTLSDISATVSTNGINYTTNTSALSITQPTLTINGGSSICTGNSPYSINNLPCNATVSWQANPLGVVTISCPTCPQTNISRNTDGQVTLTATVTTGCGQPSVTPKAITVGAVPLSSYSIIGAATVYADAGYYYTLKFPNGVLTPNNIFWRVPSGWSITYGQGTANIMVLTGNTSGPVQVNFDNVCGESTGIFKMVLIGEGGPAPLRMSMVNAFDISPNPSKGRFTVTLTSIHNNASIKEIIVVNKMGAPVYQQKFTNNQKTQTIQLANLPTDIYTVKIFDGTAWSTQKLSLQK